MNTLTSISALSPTKAYSIAPDIAELLWFADGPKQNYFPKEDSAYSSFRYFDVIVTLPYREEPSALYMNLPISKVVRTTDRPPYYPSYKKLSPDQRRHYFEFLMDPYSGKSDIGYVFIFYYGLERHLLQGKYEEAFEIILKLRDVYDYPSFQWYSANSIILSCILHQKTDYAIRFIESIDNVHELKMPASLYFLCKAGLNIPVSAFEIMTYAKEIGFNNNRYIKMHPDLFLEYMMKNIKQRHGTEVLFFRNLFESTPHLHQRITYRKYSLFANTSLAGEEIEVPDILSVGSVSDELFSLLKATHENVKSELAARRKEARK
jgi:hypothetical protein